MIMRNCIHSSRIDSENRPEVLDLPKVYLPVSPIVPPFQEDDVMVRAMNRLRHREKEARLRRNVSATGIDAKLNLLLLF
jgi:hypothetical protein